MRQKLISDFNQTVKDYYGKTLQGSADLKTDACCTSEEIPREIRLALKEIHPEVLSHYYGCGLIAPSELNGARVLDLGSGSGRDCYALAQLVGEQGEVVGVDMTDEQLAIANRHLDWHREAFGYQTSNVSFLKGYIEKLDELDLKDNSFDVIVSNCVINLSPDKGAVLKEAFRVLKPGGELYFSDVYADRRVPQHLVDDPVLYGECLSGALYFNDFIQLAGQAGFIDPRLVNSRPLGIDNDQIAQKLRGFRFWSATYRLFKLDSLEAGCEDYGQSVKYKGTVNGHPTEFRLDNHHVFSPDKKVKVCGNTWRMLNESRFSPHFEFFGDFSSHLGVFPDCGPHIPTHSADACNTNTAAGSCCAPSLAPSTISPSVIQLGSLISPVDDCCAPQVKPISSPATVTSNELREVWFHTGTHCNLSCPDCLEGASPDDSRIERLTLSEARPLLDEAVGMNVTQLCFTGGEPFASASFLPMLTYAASHCDCLVLTNGTTPFHNQYSQIQSLRHTPFNIHFRVSLDSPDKTVHDQVRGAGSFDLAVKALQRLNADGFTVSVARRKHAAENATDVQKAYTHIFEAAGLPGDLPMTAFAQLSAPKQNRTVPTVTDHCLTQMEEAGQPPDFMCLSSRMVVKKSGRLCVLPCTLVDDDDRFILKGSISESMTAPISLMHHRCYSCFSDRISCSGS